MSLTELFDQPAIIGAGLAGLAAALSAAPRPVVLLTAGTLSDGAASLWSQGGIAAAIGDDDDISLHIQDTIAAGDGLCDADVVARIISQGPAIIAQLEAYGARFDRDLNGAFTLGLEAAHSRRRIAHVRDHTGASITHAMAQAVRNAPHVTVMERARAVALSTHAGAIAGVWIEQGGARYLLRTGAVLIATGGAAGLYRSSSAPPGATGSGLALAARAGAEMRDLEFVQFHPTGLDARISPLPLISEAVRGEGAKLIDETGRRFTDELAPRDIVARSIRRHLDDGHQVFLDARSIGSYFANRFPSIHAVCQAAGIEPAMTPIPVTPVAHYHMGGIAVDVAGRSTIEGLFAAGEAACTGLHGANRLASNSLLEAFQTGHDCGVMLRDAQSRGSMAGSRCTVCSPNTGFVPDLMDRHLFVQRKQDGLASLIADLVPHAPTNDSALIALMIAVAAHDREESRGAHTRLDFPDRDTQAKPSFFTMNTAFARAHSIRALGIAA